MSGQRPKVAVVSHTLPPARNGQAIVLRRLLAGWRPEDYCLITGRDLPRQEGRLPARCVRIPEGPGWGIPRLPFVGFLADAFNFRLWTSHRAQQVARAAERERCTAVLACTGDVFDLPAAYRAARLLRLPLYAYYFDWYAHQFDAARHDGQSGYRVSEYARAMERELLPAAAVVIVPNESLQRELAWLHGVEPIIVRNPTDFPIADEADIPGPWPAAPGPVRIVYTGSVYEAHFDSFRNLLLALASLGGRFRLAVYTDQPLDFLRKGGLDGPLDLHPQVPPEQVPAILRASDVLFLPLAFDSPYPEVIRTSSPGKMGDYLTAGRPVLVHAPADSFVAWYFREHRSGLVVDRPCQASLAAALECLASDDALRQAISRNAALRAREDFSVEKARAVFERALCPQEISGRPAPGRPHLLTQPNRPASPTEAPRP